jgi:hypothetical protein
MSICLADDLDAPPRHPGLDLLHADMLTLTLAAERIADQNVRLRSFLLRLLNPDDLGWSVSAEVRALAYALLHEQRRTLP